MRKRVPALVAIGACAILRAAWAQGPGERTELEKLKAQLASLQQQIDTLRRAIEAREAASELPVRTAPEKAGALEGPLTFHIGSAFLTPVGFVDFTTINRNTTLGSGIGSNFGAIPFGNTSQGRLSESRFSAQNSRVGLRVDAPVGSAKVLGYLEADFLGFTPANAAVSTNSDTLRLRLYWVDVRQGRFEMLAGQSWSMLTPNRVGISALPADLFYSQAIDTNYMAGLTWTRQPGIRVRYHPSRTVTMGLALESSEQYIGGSAGGGTVVLPAGLGPAITGGNELNNGNTALSVPNLHPDIIAKIAFDPKTAPGHALHLEMAALESTFQDFNPITGIHYTKAGGGVSANASVELFRGFHVLTNNYYSDGGGRYLFGQAPDVVIKANGDIGLVHASSTVSGFEWTHNDTLFYGYYGGIRIGRYSVVDPADGKLVGYGYPGSPASHNRNIQEISLGFNRTFWKDPRYGALNLMGQYGYLSRKPWFVAAGQPDAAHQHLVYMNLRYTLPGSPPAIQ